MSFDRSGSFEKEVKQMNRSLAHRGPDDEGLFSGNGVTLGHRRLSIIDLSKAGHQPMSYSSNRYTIVYNGELYNFRELKRELSDMHFSTASDTEVILAAYAKWGMACVERFNGMFAFAIWDDQQKELIIARDRLGIKPLYYSVVNSKFIFSSELRSVLASGMVARKLNSSVVEEYLKYQTVHAPNTIVEKISMLMPGHLMKVDEGGMEIKQWWKPEVRSDVKETLPDIHKNIRSLLRQAVEKRLVADVPFGAFLSGGIDSSAIVGLMAEVARSEVNTFSIVFDDSEFSEAKYAGIIAKKFNTRHHELKLTPQDFLDELPMALRAMDHPSGDGPNSYVVSKTTKKNGITMALSGLGGDELFAGYPIFKQTIELDKKKWLNSVPHSIRKAGGRLVRQMKPGISSEKKSEILSLDEITFRNYYPISRQVLLNDQIRRMMTTKSGSSHLDTMQQILNGIPLTHDHLLSTVSIAEISTYMQNVLLRDTDQMSMAHALEVRVPFLDHELVEYVLSVKDEFKYPYTAKKLLTDSLGDLLPREIIDRPKMGFTFPWKNWLKKELHEQCITDLNSLADYSCFNSEEITHQWNAFLKGDPKVTWSRIWLLVVLGNWLKANEIHA